MNEFLVLVRVIFSLGVVVLLMWGLSRWLAKREGASGHAHVPVQVVGRQHLGRNQGVAVLDVGGRLLVVGTAEKNISLLTELDRETLALPNPPAPTESLESSALPKPFNLPKISLLKGEASLTRAELDERARSMAAHPAGAALREKEPGADAAAPVKTGAAAPLKTGAAAPVSMDAPADAQVIDLAQGRRATAGSVLDPATWQQAARAIKQLRKAQ